MSQFNLTPEEDALVVTALQYLADVQTASHGGATEELKSLIAKVQPAPVVEAAPVAAPVAEEAPAVEAEVPEATEETKEAE